MNLHTKELPSRSLCPQASAAGTKHHKAGELMQLYAALENYLLFPDCFIAKGASYARPKQAAA